MVNSHWRAAFSRPSIRPAAPGEPAAARPGRRALRRPARGLSCDRIAGVPYAALLSAQLFRFMPACRSSTA